MEDLAVRNLLTNRSDLDFEYKPSVRLDQINVNKSLKNQARLEAKDKKLIAQYSAAIQEGAVFPAVVLWEDTDGTYVHIDGIHRHFSYQDAGKTTTDAYIVLTDDPLVRLALTYELNTLNGRPTSEDERAYQAVHLVSTGVSRKDVAHILNVSSRLVEQAMHDYQGTERARRLGVKSAWGNIDKRPTRAKLQAGIADDKVFAESLQYWNRYGKHLRQSDVPAFVAHIKGLGSEEDRLGFIKLEAKRMDAYIEREKKNRSQKATTRRGPKDSNPRALLNAHLWYIGGVHPAPIIKVMLPEEREALTQAVQAAKRTIAEIETELVEAAKVA